MLREQDHIHLRPLTEATNLRRFHRAWNILRESFKADDRLGELGQATRRIKERLGGEVERKIERTQSGIALDVLSVTFGADRAALPLDDIGTLATSRQGLPSSYDFLRGCEWFFPAGIPNGVRIAINAAIKDVPDAEKHRRLDEQLITLYTPERVAFFIERFCAVSSVATFRSAMIGAAQAYFMGINNAAIALLAPLVEGTARRLGEQVAVELNRRLPPSSVLRVSTDVAHVDLRSLISWFSKVAIHAVFLIRPFFPYNWVPGVFLSRNFLVASDYTILILDLFQRHCADFFYSSTVQYKGVTGLNRHAMLHALTSDGFDSRGNFCRLLSMFEVLYEAAAYGLSGTDFLPIPVPAPPSSSSAEFRLHWELGRRLAAARQRAGLS